jgi:cytochrome b561
MLKNSDARYGLVAKSLHWLVFLLILNQFSIAAAMLNVPQGETLAGFTAGTLYNWHKSIGLITFAVVIVRFVWRKATWLPEWAPNLSNAEKRAISWIEHTLYVAMFLMPISGFVFVMAGDYGVNFFSRWELPRFIAPNTTMAAVAQRTHHVTAILLAVGLLAHWAVVARHQGLHRDRYVHRMLPFTHQD